MQETGSNPILAEGVGDPERSDGGTEGRRQLALLKAGALQNAILTSANFSIIATDEKASSSCSTSAPSACWAIPLPKSSDQPQRHPRSAGSDGARTELSLGLATPIAPGSRRWRSRLRAELKTSTS
jgi:hypothetical protein